jgi:Leucine-rich repeat (LRR) protein
MLRQIPPTIGQLKNIKTINLSKNNLVIFPKELCELKQLDHLDLSLNKIETLDDNIESLNAIELNLNENRLKSISPAVAKCPRLKVLRLEQNLLELSAIPVELMLHSKVSLLNLDGNLFTQKQFEQKEGYEKVIFMLLNYHLNNF